MSENSRLRMLPIILIAGVVVAAFICGLAFGQADRNPLVAMLISATPTASPTMTPSGTPTQTPTPTVSPTASLAPTLAPSATASYSATYLAINVNVTDEMTIYWKRDLWEAAAVGPMSVEDFENDESDYGVLVFPYYTGNGLVLEGDATAQIIGDDTLLESQTVIHFRDFGNGLTFILPDARPIMGFGFDYRPTETWQLAFNNEIVTIPGGRRGFIGVVLTEPVRQFELFCEELAQGGITVDNISYYSADSP